MESGKVAGNIYDIDQILEEYYDPDIVPLSEEELDQLMEEYGYDTDENMLENVLEEYYDPSVTPLSQDEMEEILLEYGDDTMIVEDVFVKEASKNTVIVDTMEDQNESKRKSRCRKRARRRGGREKKTCKDKMDIRILQTNCDGYTSKKESVEEIVTNRNIDVLLLNDTAL